MGKKVFIALLGIAAIAAYLTVREQGVDDAFDGAFAPVESVRDDGRRAEPLASLATGNSIPQTSQTDYGRVVDRVRTKANGAMQKSVERSSR